jgi:predicted enzyme related to lactoylglutathione lyase
MSERDRYPSGVPCWVETLQPDPQAAIGFYGSLFGWEFAELGRMPGYRRGEYFVAQVRGRDVAGIGPLADRSGLPAWITHIRVDSADEAADKAKSAGGTLCDGPIDVPPAGRLAVLADPAGALMCAWEAGAREGAQLVNELRVWVLSLLRTSDLENSKAFYGAVFGWQSESFGPPGSRLTLWRLPGYVGGVPEQLPVPRDVVGVMTPISGDDSLGTGQPHWEVNFWVEDEAATAENAIRLGGKVIVPPDHPPGLRNVVLADPQGSVFSVSQPPAGS